ncbi:MAG TPA: hypothetical protein VL361_04815 [Candidatus Limnocylindrales bacterium]|nr:hypothetical protein [Candidatus Limnocylindrales bacterium]
MKNSHAMRCAIVFVAAIATQLTGPAAVIPAPGLGGSALGKEVPWSQVGAAAGAPYSGDCLKITPTEHGAQMHCAFQRLDGEATCEGLWLTSTVPNQPNDRFRVKVVALGRQGRAGNPLPAQAPGVGQGPTREERLAMLPSKGDVSVGGRTVRFIRPGLIEEYTVSMDGVKQDFLVLEKPDEARAPASRLAPLRDGELRVELAVAGARVEQSAYGAQFVLEESGRKIAYSRLKAMDANGKQLPARMEVAGKSEIRNPKSEIGLAMVVDDAEAVYPVRIDPTFGDANWISMGGIPGANGYVSAAVEDGAGNLYIGGSFSIVGDVLANNIAKWNGSVWSALGSGLDGPVESLAVSGSNVYAGGNFATAGGIAATNIAKWNGNAWSALGSGMAGEVEYPPRSVSALAVSGSDLYAGGNFTNAGGITANYIAKWDGSAWSALGSGMGGGVQYPPIGVSALAVSGSDLYAGGNFTTAGGTTANYIAKWDGSAWSALSSGMDNPVSALAVSGSEVYAGGNFAAAGGIAATNIAKWNGSAWSAVGLGIGAVVQHAMSGVSALAVSGSDVYAGWYTNPICAAGGCAGGTAGVAKWNGSTWSALGSEIGIDLGPRVTALAISDGLVYAGGYFTKVDGGPANYIANWNGSAWSALSPGMGMGNETYPLVPVVNALAVSGSNVFAGGDFITAGGSPANYIAKWNGSGWSALGSGMGMGNTMYPVATVVNALAVSGSDLYAGGYFTTAGGVPATNIAKWDGSAWSAVGLGVNSTVSALAVSDSNLYAGGWFTTAGGVAANYIAKWDGSAWSPLGLGVNSPVLALAVSGSTLYAAGQFTTAGGSPASKIARWDSSAWTALGSGTDYQVNALAVSGSALYAGGYFDNAGGIGANYIAKWNGSSWSALGSGVDYYVSALAVSGSDVYAGGNIYTAGGKPANGIAKWDGSSWSALGSGVNGPVDALALSGRYLYVAGAFTTAGGKVSAYTAKADLGPPPFYFVTTNSSMGFSNGQFYFTLAGPAGSNAVIFASTNLQTWGPLVTNPLTGGSLNFTDTLATNFTKRFYRALLQP